MLLSRTPEHDDMGEWFAWRPVFALSCKGKPAGLVWRETVSYFYGAGCWVYQRIPEGPTHEYSPGIRQPGDA